MKKYKSIGSHIANEQFCSTGLPLCVPVVFNMEEIWKDVPNYEGYYQISNYGRIKSFKLHSCGYVLKNTNKNGWYFTVVLQGINKNTTTKRIHRLVAEAFIPNPNNLPDVNHKDLNKQNNHYLNLEWVTSSENNHHARLHNPNILRGINNYNRFIRPCRIIQKSLNGIFVDEFINAKEASDRTGVCQRNILQVAHKTEYKPGLIRKQAGGFIWELK